MCWALLCLSLAQVACGCARARPIVDAEQWFGVYMLKKKIGYAVLQVGEQEEGGEKLVYMRAMTYARLGSDEASELLYDIRQWAAPDDFALRRLEAIYRSGGKTIRTEARAQGDTITYVLTTPEGETEETLSAEQGEKVVADLSFLLTGPPKQPRKFTYFNILTLKLDCGEFYTDEDWKGTVLIRGSGTVGKYILELDENEKIKCGYGAFGIKLEPQEKLQARDLGTDDYLQWLELAIPSTIKGGKEIAAPSRVVYLRAKVFGIDPQKMPEIEGRQKVLQRGENWSLVEVKAQDVREVQDAPQLPIAAPELAEALSPTAYLTCDSEEIRRAAEEALAGESNAALAAAKLCRFVDEKLRYSDTAQVPRRADEILRSGVGVCRDYAALYAALARAVGLPTRLCCGVVYSHGAFYLHAWAQSFVGRWVAVDPTRSGRPADATHITFALTDVAGLWDLTLYGPEVRVEVEEYRVE